MGVWKPIEPTTSDATFVPHRTQVSHWSHPMLVPALALHTPTRPFAARFFNLDSPDVLGYKPFRRLCHGVTLSLTATQDVGRSFMQSKFYLLHRSLIYRSSQPLQTLKMKNPVQRRLRTFQWAAA